MANIDTFKASFKDGGARTSQFEVYITNPIDPTSDAETPLRCKAAQLPGRTINNIDVSYFGRPIKVAGNSTYEDWTVTFFNNEDFRIHDGLMAWANAINQPVENVRGTATSSILEYKSTALVYQKSQTGKIVKVFEVVGIYPTNISAIELSWDNEAVQEFQVTFAVDYWVEVEGVGETTV
ncbi:baseplate wedge subunit [Ochrobactrum phage vB_OspM_OC]|nr:baseplate wedge subunit [Ochrobactrum phage vB_OspM_OC]